MKIIVIVFSAMTAGCEVLWMSRVLRRHKNAGVTRLFLLGKAHAHMSHLHMTQQLMLQAEVIQCSAPKSARTQNWGGW